MSYIFLRKSLYIWSIRNMFGDRSYYIFPAIMDPNNPGKTDVLIEALGTEKQMYSCKTQPSLELICVVFYGEGW